MANHMNKAPLLVVDNLQVDFHTRQGAGQRSAWTQL